MAVTNNIIHIEEFTLAAGNTEIVYSVSGTLPNALIGIYCDHYGVYPIDCKRENNSIHITYEPQSTTMHVALFFLMDDMIIENNLLSDSETHALSASQGKILKDLIPTDCVTAGSFELKEVENSEFETVNGGRLESCLVDFIPIQSGSGDPSPDNIRPITGHTSVEVTISDENETVIEDVTVSLGGTYYGGTLDVVTGTLTIDKYGEELSDLTWSTRNTGTNNKLLSASVSYLFDKTNFDFITEKYEYIEPVGGIAQFGPPDDEQKGIYPITTSSSRTIYIVTSLSDTISGKVVYKLATPIEIQLTPQQVNALIGENNIDTPLTGQSLDEATYREAFVYSDIPIIENIADIPNVNITSPSNGQVLTYDDGEWINANSSAGGVEYSTNERIIGSYFGETLYEKSIVISSTVTLGTSYVITHDLSDIKKIVNIDGEYYDVTDSRQIPLPNIRQSYSETVFIASFLPSNNIPVIALQSGGTSYGSIKDIVITVRYTKIS